MNKDKVPQDENPTYQGYGTKVMYAVDDSGSYTTVKSSGWEVEEIVLRDVVDDFKAKAEESKERILADKASPIEYFMHLKFMDLPALAHSMGWGKWRVKRHLTPQGFKRLDADVLQRYADFFNIEVDRLIRFKEYLNVE